MATVLDVVKSACYRWNIPFPAAGTLYNNTDAGALGLFDTWKSKRGEEKGAAEGAISGAALGASVGGAPGALVGGLIGGVMGAFRGGPSTREREQKRWKGVGRADMAEGNFLEDSFKGQESEIGIDQIRVNPDNYRAIPKWDTWNTEMQDEFLTRMLAADQENQNAVNIKKGGVYYDDSLAKKIAKDVSSEYEEKNMKTSKKAEEYINKARNLATKKAKGLMAGA